MICKKKSKSNNHSVIILTKRVTFISVDTKHTWFRTDREQASLQPPIITLFCHTFNLYKQLQLLRFQILHFRFSCAALILTVTLCPLKWNNAGQSHDFGLLGTKTNVGFSCWQSSENETLLKTRNNGFYSQIHGLIPEAFAGEGRRTSEGWQGKACGC